MSLCRSQWPCGLRRRSAAARLLRLWVRIPPGAWMFVCYDCRMLSGRGLCDELITRPEESYRLWCVVVCDLETSRMRPWPALGRRATAKKKKEFVTCDLIWFTLNKVENIVKWIKGQKIIWLGQLERMEEDRMPKKIFTQELAGTSRRVKPRKGWREEAERDLQVLGVRRWRELVIDREKWRGIVRQAKTHSGL